MTGIGAPTGKAFESVFADVPKSGVESLVKGDINHLASASRQAVVDVISAPFATVWNMCKGFGSKMLGVGGAVLKAPLRIPWIPQ
ncbi:MAG: hypothetical protein QF755_05410 [Candidatus Peribacteraceae bacterium]|jgi:hypothetical protein|nr:hypothetical protein [Candidatus Peribacteraceae bacterium]HCI03772.1 hypothetical protein [Candidatus Peribacteria bacterium]|tara:strand:+ start:7252 stop:7506 length:255 start_codon:yes stop_codon:yes gene_type:complete